MISDPVSPPKPKARGQFVSTVLHNAPLCDEHFRLTLRLDSFPPTDPGQFVQLACREIDVDFEREAIDWQPGDRLELPRDEFTAPAAMLRRPFSLAGRRDTSVGVEIDVIHRVVGIGTEWLSRLRSGDAVSVLGPLGNRFELPPPDTQAILVGGGVGIPPMLYLAERLAGRNAVAFCGALRRSLLPLTIRLDPAPGEGAEPVFSIAEFARHGVRSVVTTDDGSYGFRGFVTQALEAYLDSNLKSATPSPILYTCGPEPMMKRVAQIAADRNLVCQIAVERAMACGMGTCQSCCIKVRKPDKMQPPLVGSDWCYRLACTDGPVFKGADLLW